jgi:hypothetical protein
VVLVGLTVLVPLVAKVPVHPPDAVQAVEFVDDQVKVELPPAVMLVELADNVAVGTALAATVTTALEGCELPPVPAQVNV